MVKTYIVLQRIGAHTGNVTVIPLKNNWHVQMEHFKICLFFSRKISMFQFFCTLEYA